VDEVNHNKSLNHLLRNHSHGREIKLSIALLLVEHANSRGDEATDAFLQQTLQEILIIMNDDQADSTNRARNDCNILFEAGMLPRSAMYIAVQPAGNVSTCQWLVRARVSR
jgi:hypothetical protein